MNVTGALAYVAFTSTKNRILMGIRKLRNGRYLISALFGLAYMFMMFSRNFTHAGRRVQFVYAGADSIAVDVMAGVIFLLLVLVWAWPSDDAGIAMSEAEMQILFSAPVSRRDILLYRFFRSQLGLLISAVMTSIFGFRTRSFTGLAGLWLFFASLSMYFTMAGQLRARLRKIGVTFIVRIIAVAAIIGGACWWAAHVGTFQTPLIHALLFVPRFFALATLPNVPLAARLGSMAFVIAFAVICFWIAATVKVDFEEGSLVLSQKKANTVTRQRNQQSGQWIAFKRLPPPFRLGDTGVPDIAIIWKNLIASLRIGMMPIVIMVAAMLFLIGQSFFMLKTAGDAIGALMLLMCAIIPLLSANLFAQDLRLDITRIEYLKTFPMSGERIVAAEMAAPLIVMSLVELLFLTVTSIYLNTHGDMTKFARFATPQNMLCVFIFTVPICAVLTVMRNAAVLLFPAWILRSKEEPRGFVVTGQRLVVMLGNLIVLSIVLIPAGIVFAPALFIAYRFFSGSPAFLAIASLPPVAIILTEVWFGVRMLGKYFDEFDASNELDRVMT